MTLMVVVHVATSSSQRHIPRCVQEIRFIRSFYGTIFRTATVQIPARDCGGGSGGGRETSESVFAANLAIVRYDFDKMQRMPREKE